MFRLGDTMSKIDIIRDVFQDNRRMFEIEEELFVLADEPGVVRVSMHFGDFTPESLAEITEEAEELYERFGNVPVFSYIVLDRYSNVTVAEHKIVSEADFTIKVAKVQGDPIAMAFKMIEERIANRQITERDINMLHILPMMADKGQRKSVRAKASELLTKAMEA